MALIPVRVRADKKPEMALEGPARNLDMALQPDHPLAMYPCPVCDLPLGPVDDPAPKVCLVFVGIAPEDRKQAGYTTGAAVCVHTACATGETGETG